MSCCSNNVAKQDASFSSIAAKNICTSKLNACSTITASSIKVPGLDGTSVIIDETGLNVVSSAGVIASVGPQGIQGEVGPSGLVGPAGPIGPGSAGYAEFVQLTQSPNDSIAPGAGVTYTVDNPTGVFNTLGITLDTVPGGQGTAFLLPAGRAYIIDFENSNDQPWALAIYKSTALATIAAGIDNNTIAGSTTATTWIHGRAIVVATVPTYIMISPVTNTHAIPTAGNAPVYIARITFLDFTI